MSRLLPASVLALGLLALPGCKGLEEIFQPRGDGSGETSPPPGDGGGSEGGGQGGTSGPSADPGSGTRQGDTYVLDPRWRPLERIVERGMIPGLSGTATTTVSPDIYVADLDRWLERHPPGTPLFDAILLHEQLHAERQEQAGVQAWVDRYLADTDFMWREEQLGWYEQLQHLRRSGLRLDAQAVANNLASYRNLKGRMVGREDALTWVQDVLEGRWRPPPD